MYNYSLFFIVLLALSACTNNAQTPPEICPPVRVEHLGQIPEPAPRIIYKTKVVHVKDPTSVPEPKPKHWWQKHHW